MYKYLSIVLLLSANSIFAQLPGKHSEKTLLPNGWSLSPYGRSLGLGDLPLNLAVSPSKRYLAVTNNGQSTQSIQLIDIKTEKLLFTKVIPKSWYGLKWSSNEKYIYAAGGYDDRILKYAVAHDTLVLADSIQLPKLSKGSIVPTGIDINDVTANILYVVTKDDSSLYTIDLNSKAIISHIPIGAEAYCCVLSTNKQYLYISLWGGDKVLIYNTKTGAITASIPVGDNPNELILNKANTLLYVANANDNSVSVIDLKTNTVIETLQASLYPNAPSGSTTNGLALSEDNKTLYIANADNNCLALFDVSNPRNARSIGFIPVGWYPSNVRVAGKKILVANGKGYSSFANPKGPNPADRREKVIYKGAEAKQVVQYIGGLFTGTLSIFEEPKEKELALLSKEVYENTPYSKQKETFAEHDADSTNPIPARVGQKSPIKYIFYILKENRTYDQVMGDMPNGNGDTSLVLFGNNITPNQHKIAQQFVLLDNFYVDGEVSSDGHNWSMGAYATDYLEKTWPTSYGGRGGRYDAEGNSLVANNKNGFIWDLCARNHVSYRSYGEFVDKGHANLPVLQNHFCNYFRGWDLNVRDTTRFTQWKQDFDSLYAAGNIPIINTIRLGNDHTEGLRKGRPTPFAHVADNDLAVGEFVEYLSKSPIWKESVVFITEDDAQNGPDHVDAHRSIAFLAGPFVKHGYVDHTLYSTSGFLRTMELIAGLPPMTQYDAAATPLWRAFMPSPNYSLFTYLPSNIPLTDTNAAFNKLSQRSEKLNFRTEDQTPDDEFNKILWAAVKGEHTTYPGVKHAAFVKVKEGSGD